VATADPSQHAQADASNVLGRFRLLAELGRGGMSEVYLAVIAGPAGFNKLVVIKLIKAELAEDPDFIGMFLEEARLSARLNHPNIVQTNEVGNIGGRYYIAMEYLEGQPYSRVLHRLGRDRGLPLGMSLRLLSDVLAGLQYAHDLTDFDGTPLGVVHRDVTPHNIFVTYDGQVKVVDFGIAKAMNSSHETRAGMLKGKIGYMAPEQARGERVDRRADIFSVGVMLWEAAVGRRLWKGMNEVQILHQLLSGEIPRPRSMRGDISDHLEHIILRSLAPDRDERYASCTELQTALEELMDSGGERGALREVGRVVTHAFDEERRKLKGIIEQQLAKSNMLATGMYQQMPLPALDPQTQFTGEHPAHGRGSMMAASSSLPQLGAAMAHTGSGPSLSQVGSYGPTSSHGVRPGAHTADGYTASGASSIPSFHTVPVSGSYPGGQHQSSPSVSSQPSAPTGSIAHTNLSRPGAQEGGYAPPNARAADSSNRLTFVVLGVAAVAGVLAALLYVGVGRREPTPAIPSSAPVEPAATNAPTDLRPRELKLEIVVKPVDATIFLDDEKLDGNPYRATLSHDGKEHQLRIEAPGRETRTRTIRADETSVTWEVELPLAVDPAVSASTTATSTAPAVPYRPVPRPPPTTKDPTPTPEPKPSGKRPTRPIDPSYPGG
jgi:eukaryotic-like serine/threonine-protein kinase